MTNTYTHTPNPFDHALTTLRNKGGTTPCDGRPEWTSRNPHDRLTAATLCMTCPLRATCRDAALTNGEASGVWGGIDLNPGEGRGPGPQAKNELTTIQLKQIDHLWKAGYGPIGIADRLGIPRHLVRREVRDRRRPAKMNRTTNRAGSVRDKLDETYGADDVARIIALFNEGADRGVIARQIGLSVWKVKYVLRTLQAASELPVREGRVGRPSKVTAELDAQIQVLRGEGLAWREVGLRVGLSESAVRDSDRRVRARAVRGSVESA